MGHQHSKPMRGEYIVDVDVGGGGGHHHRHRRDSKFGYRTDYIDANYRRKTATASTTEIKTKIQFTHKLNKA